MKKEYELSKGIQGKFFGPSGELEILSFKLQVNAGLKELDEGKGIPHEQVEKRLKKWLSK